ncbi:LacI family transcriptional regulator [Brachybacterium sp. SGAir0954]|uniref:LacI family DNA-binding transcriptional regulator n=1 Tax=Brachybacterium sp. SGAir0954 TaxID=2571029 RepID=UPI0010CD1680|nr:LacI family DNA-binding transcriptional regulator [Brachybacterium sp. SGAir0954]QCR52251.1 LacI family transcriptional regulator [Brachybacterium sp. SGAir0954]
MTQHRKATIGDVAERAGVTKATVSLAYSGKRPVSEETRQRIFAAAEELQWTASHRARALATSRTGAIGLVVARDPEVLATDAFFSKFISGCERVLAEHDMGLMLHAVTTRVAEQGVYERLAAGRADGAILLDVRQEDPRFALVRRLGLPAVVLSAEEPTDGETGGLPTVYSDDSPAIAEIVRLMAEAGHTRIAHVAGPSPYIHARIRRETFTAAMAEHGLDGSLVVEGAFTAASGRDATAQLLDLAEPPTAIVYANDTMAISGLSLAHSRGIRVPEELSISGYDDSELSAHLSPALTTVSTGAVQRGEIAVRTLLAALDGEEPGAVLADHTVVVPRGSIAAPRR